MTNGGADALSKAVCVEEVQPELQHQWQSITGHLPTQGHCCQPPLCCSGELGIVKDARCALSVAVEQDEELADMSEEYMKRLDKHIEFLEVDMYADWHEDQRIVLEFENRELSFRGLIMQLAAKCSVDVTFPDDWL